MYITYDELLALPSMKHASIISGEKGVNRIISWFHLIELDDVYKWIEPNSILFVNGVAFENVERSLLKIIKAVEQKGSAGIIIPISPSIRIVPQSIIDLSNQWQIPIIRIPLEAKLIEITYQIAEKLYTNGTWEKSIADFLKDVVYFKNRKGLQKRAAYFGYSEKNKYRAVVISIDDIDNYLEGDRDDLYFNMDIIANCIITFCRKQQIEPLFYKDNYNFIIMLNNQLSNYELKKRVRGLHQDIYNNKIKLTVSIGIGKEFTDLDSFASSIEDAQNVLYILHACRSKDSVEIYDELGIYRLLFLIQDKDELTSIMKHTLKDLCRERTENNIELLKTLEMYFECGGNLKEASEKMYIHRNTLKYRLAKIEEILKSDLKDASTEFNLRLAIYIMHYLNVNN